MRIQYEHTFDAPLPTVAQMFHTEAFAQSRTMLEGATVTNVTIDGEFADEFTVSIRREVPSTAIPSEFRGLVGSSLSVVYTEVWEPPTEHERHATWAIEVIGTPGRARGTIVIRKFENQTDFDLDGEVIVSMPFIGPMIEKALGDAILTGIGRELQGADQWLEQGGC